MLKRQSGFSDVRVEHSVPCLTWQPSSRCRSTVGTPTGFMKDAGLRGPDVLSLQSGAQASPVNALEFSLDRVVHHGVYGLCLSPDHYGRSQRRSWASRRRRRPCGMVNAGQRNHGLPASFCSGYLNARTGSFSYGDPDDDRHYWRAADSVFRRARENRAAEQPL